MLLTKSLSDFCKKYDLIYGLVDLDSTFDEYKEKMDKDDFSEFMLHSRKQTDFKQVLVIGYRHANKTMNNFDGKVASFAWGIDYHVKMKSILELLVEECKIDKYEILIDTHALNERYYAVKAGIAYIGNNQMAINYKFGSYFHIGLVLLNSDELIIQHQDISCKSCTLCISNCPVNALENGFNHQKCISTLTQTKNLKIGQYQDISNHFYGCDICQSVCPKNQVDLYSLEDSHIQLKPFINHPKSWNKQFIQDKTYAWRRVNILRRNAIINLLNLNQQLDLENEEIRLIYEEWKK